MTVKQFRREFVAEFGDVKISQLGGMLSGLRCVFDVERDKLPWANNVELQVYNLSETTRARMTKAGPVAARISAGYVGEAKQLFFGVLDIVEHLKDGADWVTHMSASDAGEKIKQTKVSLSFTKGQTMLAVIRGIVKTLGIGEGNLNDFANDRYVLEPLTHGGALHGNAVEELTYFLRAVGLEFSIQDGKPQFVQIGQGVPNLTGPKLDVNHGLVGSPRLVREKATDLTRKKTKRDVKNSILTALGEKVDMITTIEATCLLQGQIMPGMPIEIASASVNAQALVCAVKHSGDTRGNDWYTDLKAIPLGDL